MVIHGQPIKRHYLSIIGCGENRWARGVMVSAELGASEVSILGRVFRADAPGFSPESARDILALDFAPIDRDRMRELSAKARAGTVTAAEDAEMGRYELVGHLLNIMQSKARRTLKDHVDPPPNRPRMP